MTRNLTLRLDEAIIRNARIRAVKKDMSVSQWVSCLVQQAVSHDAEYAATRKAALEAMEEGFHLGGMPLTQNDAYGNILIAAGTVKRRGETDEKSVFVPRHCRLRVSSPDGR